MTVDIPIKRGTELGAANPVLRPENWPNSEFANGVGTPQILHSQETEGTKLLFTGWTNESSRHLFVADIDDSLTVTNPTKILDASTYGSISGAQGFYDPVNNQWVLGIGISTNYPAIILFSQDFSTVDDFQGYGADANIKDSGAVAFATRDGSLKLSYTTPNEIIEIGGIQTNYSARPLSTSLSKQEVLRPLDTERPDVHSVIQTPAGHVILSEFNTTDQWSIKPVFIGETNGKMVEKMQALVSERPLVGFSDMSGGGQFGHPTYTTALGRPMVLFDWFRSYGSGIGVDAVFEHEIWMQEVPWDHLTPQNWFPMHARVLSSGATSDDFRTFGASKILINLDATGTGSGDSLTITEAHSSAQIANNNAIQTKVGDVTSDGRYRFVYNDPLPFVALFTDGGWTATTLDVTLIE